MSSAFLLRLLALAGWFVLVLFWGRHVGRRERIAADNLRDLLAGGHNADDVEREARAKAALLREAARLEEQTATADEKRRRRLTREAAALRREARRLDHWWPVGLKP